MLNIRNQKLFKLLVFSFLSPTLYCTYTENNGNNPDAVSVAEDILKENDEDNLDAVSVLEDILKESDEGTSKIIKIVYKKRKDVKSEDKGKYIPINVEGIPVLFEITGDFTDNWHPRWPIFSSAKYETSCKKLNDDGPYIDTMEKFNGDGPKFIAKTYDSCSDFYLASFAESRLKLTEFTDHECTVIHSDIEGIKSTDVGKFILVGLKNFPMTFQISGEFDDDWANDFQLLHATKGKNFVKVVFSDSDRKQVGPTLLNAFKSLDSI